MPPKNLWISRWYPESSLGWALRERPFGRKASVTSIWKTMWQQMRGLSGGWPQLANRWRHHWSHSWSKRESSISTNRFTNTFLSLSLYPKKEFGGKPVDITVREVLSHMGDLHDKNLLTEENNIYEEFITILEKQKNFLLKMFFDFKFNNWIIKLNCLTSKSSTQFSNCQQ